MPHINIEIKAHCKDPQSLRKKLMLAGAVSHGMDHQIDTYFQVPQGRLKLRQGNIENNLIYYERNNQSGPKKAYVYLYHPAHNGDLLQLLEASLGIKVVVDKSREIFFIENVKFHIDYVEGLGSFMEIEAIDKSGKIGQNSLRKQCDHYLELLGITDDELISTSYSDLLIQKKNGD